MKSTIRQKLTLWLILTTTGMFLIMAGFISLVVWQVLHDQIDHHLHVVITEAEQIVTTFASHQRNQLLEKFISQQGMTVTLLSPDGSALIQTNSARVANTSEHVLQQILSKTQSPTGEPVHFNIDNVRFASVPITVPGGRGVLAVGYSLEIVENTFRNILGIIAATSVVGLVALSYGVGSLLKKHLNPLEDIAAKARLIKGKESLHVRFPEQTNSSEITLLSEAMNQMIGKLQHIFTTESQFFSDAAHTLKTPLAVLRSKIESFTKLSAKEKDQTLELLDQASETIHDLLLLSRLETHEPVGKKQISLTKILEEISDITKTLADEKKIATKVNIAPDVFIYANASLLKRALANLVENAVNYTPVNGRIEIKLDVKEAKGIITISDSGAGIPAKDLKKVFNRFYRTNHAKNIPGSGLGLAIAKAVIESEGGTISLKSQEEKGTAVTVTLPIS